MPGTNSVNLSLLSKGHEQSCMDIRDLNASLNLLVYYLASRLIRGKDKKKKYNRGRRDSKFLVSSIEFPFEVLY